MTKEALGMSQVNPFACPICGNDENVETYIESRKQYCLTCKHQFELPREEAEELMKDKYGPQEEMRMEHAEMVAVAAGRKRKLISRAAIMRYMQQWMDLKGITTLTFKDGYYLTSARDSLKRTERMEYRIPQEAGADGSWSIEARPMNNNVASWTWIDTSVGTEIQDEGGWQFVDSIESDSDVL